jgi:transcriptional regulator with XRE-family HTH domain
VGSEIRDTRVGAGLSLAAVGRSARLSASQVSRIERGLAPNVSVDRLAVLGLLVGLDVRIRTFPGGDPLRDVGQQRVLDRLSARLAAGCRLRREVTLGIDGDLRAWDGRIEPLVGADGAAVGLEVEVETRLADGQAFLRRLARKMRDAGIESVLVVVSDTPSNVRRSAPCRSSADRTSRSVPAPPWPPSRSAGIPAGRLWSSCEWRRPDGLVDRRCVTRRNDRTKVGNRALL